MVVDPRLRAGRRYEFAMRTTGADRERLSRPMIPIAIYGSITIDHESREVRYSYEFEEGDLETHHESGELEGIF
jgi:hypothetical protein